MRHIVKGDEPKALRDWKRENRETTHVLTYDNCPKKNEIRLALLIEQGFLCAYTMRAIPTPRDAHIEHVRPRWKYREFSIEYANMVACCPGDGIHLDYGAKLKDRADVNDEVFVSPLHGSCERRFVYRIDGRVYPADNADVAAKNTIRMLDLNHRDLVDSRIQQLERFGLYGPRLRRTKAVRWASARQARRAAERALEHDHDGRLTAFCIAVRQVAERYACAEEAKARRLTSPNR